MSNNALHTRVLGKNCPETPNCIEKEISQKWSGGGYAGIILADGIESDEGNKVLDILSLQLHDFLMNSVEDDRIGLLKSAITLLKERTAALNESRGKQVRVYCSIALFVENFVYVAASKKIPTYIIKGENALNVATISNDDCVFLSGQIDTEDIILFSRIQLAEKFDTNALYAGHLHTDNKLLIASYSAQIEEIQDEAQETVEVPLQEKTPEYETEALSESVVEDKSVPSSGAVLQNDTSVGSQTNLLVTNFGNAISSILKRVGTGILSVFTACAGWIIETIIGSRSGKYKLPSDRSFARRRVMLLIAFFVFVGGLYISIKKLEANKLARENQRRYDEVYDNAESTLVSAKEKSTYSKTETLKLLNDLDALIQELSTIKVSNADSSLLQKGKEEVIDTLEKRVRIESPEVISDLKIWIESAEPTDFVYYDTALWITDSQNHSLYKVSVGGETTNNVQQVFSSKDGLDQPSLIDLIEDKLYIYDNKNGVFEFDPASSPFTLKELAGLSSSSIGGNVAEMSNYSGGLYFLVPETGKIIRSVPAGSGFSLPQLRLTSDEFKSAVDMDINGLIYLSTSTGLIRYYGDNKDTQLILDDVGELQDIGKFDLYATESLALIDRSQKRILLLSQPTQSGSSVFKLKKQYVFSGGSDNYFNDLKEVDFDLSTGDLYVLDGFRVIRIKATNE